MARAKPAIDPLDEDGTEKAVRLLHGKWGADFKQFCADRLKVPDRNARDGAAMRFFGWNDCQNAMWMLRERIIRYNLRQSELVGSPPSKYPIKVVVLKARKVGISTWIKALEFWRSEHEPNFHGLTIAHEESATQLIAKITQTFHYNFHEPELDRNGVSARHPVERVSDDLMTWAQPHGSTLTNKTAGGRKQKARGGSPIFLHSSEEAYHGSGNELSAAITSMIPYHETYSESTASGVGGIFANKWANSMWIEELEACQKKGVSPKAEWNGYVRFFWSWLQDQDYRLKLAPGDMEMFQATLSKTERELMDRLGMDWEQLKFRRRKIATEGTSQSELSPEDWFRQEYPATPEEAFVSAGNSVFDSRLVADMEANAKTLPRDYYNLIKTGEAQFEKVEVESLRDASLTVFQEPQVGHVYIGASDSADGLKKGDWSTVVIYDRTDGTCLVEAARFHAKVGAEDLGDVCYWLGHWYGDAFLIPERNPPGNVTCVRLANLNYPNLYMTQNPETIRQNDRSYAVGFYSRKHIKGLLIEMSRTVLRDGRIQVRHPTALREWRIFETNDKSASAPTGDHDDCVITDMMCCYGAYTPGVAPISSFRPRGKTGSQLSALQRGMKKWWDRNRKEEAAKAAGVGSGGRPDY